MSGLNEPQMSGGGAAVLNATPGACRASTLLRMRYNLLELY